MAEPVYKRPDELAKSYEKETKDDSKTEKMEEGKKDWSKIVDDLILDEQEAIESYQGAIDFINEQDGMPQEEKDNLIRVMNLIIKDEENHIAALNKVKQGKASEIKEV